LGPWSEVEGLCVLNIKGVGHLSLRSSFGVDMSLRVKVEKSTFEILI